MKLTVNKRTVMTINLEASVEEINDLVMELKPWAMRHNDPHDKGKFPQISELYHRLVAEGDMP